MQNHALRSVLQLLAGMDDDYDEDEDPQWRVLHDDDDDMIEVDAAGNRDMLFLATDEDDTSSYDEDETAAAVGFHQVLGSMRSSRKVSKKKDEFL